MKQIVVLKGNSGFIENTLNNQKIPHEIYGSIEKLVDTYKERYVQCDKVVISDNIFTEEGNNVNKIEELHEMLISPGFKYKRLHILVSQSKLKIELIQILESILKDILDEKVEIHKFDTNVTAIDIYNVILSKKETKETIVNTYEEVVKVMNDGITLSSKDPKNTRSVKYDDPNVSILATVDYKKILEYESVRKLLASGSSEIRSIPTSETNISSEGIETLIPESLPNEKIPSTNKIIITGERSSGKFTLALALTLSLFQNDKSVMIYDMTDNSSFSSLSQTKIDHIFLDVNNLPNNPHLISEHIKSVRSKMLGVVTGDTELVYEYSKLLSSSFKLLGNSPDYEIYVINLTKAELIDTSDISNILIATSYQEKYVASMCNLAISKFKSNARNINMKIVPTNIHTKHNDVIEISVASLEEKLSRMFEELDCEGNNVNIIYTSPILNITGLNMEGKFARDMLGGVV